MSARRTWIVLLPVVVLLIAGCGGGGSGGGETTATSTAATKESNSGALTEAELIEQGDAICAETYAAVAPLNPEGSKEEAVKVASLYSNMTKSLEDLGTPQETNYDYAEYLNGLHALAEAANGIKSTAARKETAEMEHWESGSLSALSGFQAAASTYGFKDCAEGASSSASSAASEAGETESEAPASEEEAAPETAEPEAEEAAPETAPETGGASGVTEGGGSGAPESSGGSPGGGSGGIGPG